MSSDDDLGPQLSGRLAFQLKRAFLALEDLHRTYLEPFGISGRELSILLLLDGREPESQQETAERLQVDRTTMVGLLDGLEAKGLVERRADPRDRRRNVVAVTPVGRRTLKRAVRASDEAEAQLLGALDATQQAEFRRLLAHVHADTAATD